jgi:hypothetical protein
MTTNSTNRPIKVGVITDITGPLSFAGVANANVAKMVIDDIKTVGRISGVEVYILDRSGCDRAPGFLVVGRLSDPRPVHQFALPPGIDLGRYNAVCIWSRAAGASLATAPLALSITRSNRS